MVVLNAAVVNDREWEPDRTGDASKPLIVVSVVLLANRMYIAPRKVAVVAILKLEALVADPISIPLVTCPFLTTLIVC